ncbi:HAD-IIB family hydrolase [Paenibacillus eucommiae]|uniref:Cof subfamily protein (Haloacid dehalogenase superfamily) n=1 Tax=Paenibacillus eucommiae TaxID=1355755 RepID=A0ABS4J3M4_9BACL|nr:HAD-IIB family hydrolase [Paenibacillus eucommiae]MBP1994444.1 Cof subfamily protein (haloacid dehalogenase superfamily) [Paenibacillus eucommiae]
MNTLYVSDLDGTLLDDNQAISMEALEILNHLIEQGMKFTIATARSIESAREILQGLKINLPLVLINGVFIYDYESNRNVKSNYLSGYAGARIIQTYLELGLNPLVYTTDCNGNSIIHYKGVFNQSEDNYIGSRLSKGDKRFRLVENYEACMDENIITINAIDTPAKLNAAYKEYIENIECVCHFGPDIYTPGFHWLEIANCHATKKQAVLYLKEKYHFDRLVCFGDNLNDLPMFEAADEKYAVSNAHEMIRNVADKVIDSNLNNGVPKYLSSVFGL